MLILNRYFVTIPFGDLKMHLQLLFSIQLCFSDKECQKISTQLGYKTP